MGCTRGAGDLQDSAFFPFALEIAGNAARLHARVFLFRLCLSEIGANTKASKRAHGPCPKVCLLFLAPMPPHRLFPLPPCLTTLAAIRLSIVASLSTQLGLLHMAWLAWLSRRLSVEPRLLVVRSSGRNPGTGGAAPSCLGTHPQLPSRARPSTLFHSHRPGSRARQDLRASLCGSAPREEIWNA